MCDEDVAAIVIDNGSGRRKVTFGEENKIILSFKIK
jgi:actin-related protein